MATQKKQRSTFWIVSTHVATAGFAMPFFGYVFGVVLSVFLGLQATQSFVTILAINALGYIVGLFQSLSYIRKIALHPDFTRCIKPAIVTFIILTVVGAAANVAFVIRDRSFYDALFIPFLIVTPIYYVIMTSIFVQVTRHGFRALAQESTEE